MVPEERLASKECSGCRWWRAILEDARGAIGPCRLAVRPGDFPGTAPACERYLARDAAIPSPPAPARPPTGPAPRPPSLRPVGAKAADGLPEELLDMTREELTEAIRQALSDEAPVALASKWEGGTLVLRPKDPKLQAKELPLDHLFHKIVMVRDRLRVLEQKINTSERLSDAEKVEMQQYITRCYGTLTTFNVLFREERDKFVGEKT